MDRIALIVGSDELLLRIYEWALESIGCSVVVGPPGERIEPLLARLRPALVLVDSATGDRAAADAIRAVRACEGGAALVVLAVAPRAADVQALRDAGCTLVVSRPFDVQDFVSLAGRCLGLPEPLGGAPGLRPDVAAARRPRAPEPHHAPPNAAPGRSPVAARPSERTFPPDPVGAVRAASVVEVAGVGAAAATPRRRPTVAWLVAPAALGLAAALLATPALQATGGADALGRLRERIESLRPSAAGRAPGQPAAVGPASPTPPDREASGAPRPAPPRESMPGDASVAQSAASEPPPIAAMPEPPPIAAMPEPSPQAAGPTRSDSSCPPAVAVLNLCDVQLPTQSEHR